MTKRSVTTDALETLGTIIDDQQKRDAIHLAVEPVVVGDEDHTPGCHVTVRDGISYRIPSGHASALGIIDPFLDRTADIKKGDRVWFVMYPRTVHSLRHVWTHPAFRDEVAVALDQATAERRAEAERWIRAYLEEEGFDYGHIMRQVAAMITDDINSGSGSDFHPSGEFWAHAEIAIGVKLVHRPDYFKCGC